MSSGQDNLAVLSPGRWRRFPLGCGRHATRDAGLDDGASGHQSNHHTVGINGHLLGGE